MPITKSARKALKQSKRNRIFNDRRKLAMRGVIKDIKKKLAGKQVAEAEALIPEAYKAIDKATKRGIIKANTGSRKKSRLQTAIKKAK